MSNPRNKHVTLERSFVFFLRAMPFSLMKPWHKFLFVAAVFGFVSYVTFSVGPRGDRITQRESSSRALSLAQDVRAEDRNFLDDLVQKQSYDDHHSGNSLSAPSHETWSGERVHGRRALLKSMPGMVNAILRRVCRKADAGIAARDARLSDRPRAGAPLICHSSASQALIVSPASAKATGASWGGLWPASTRLSSWRPMNISA